MSKRFRAARALTADDHAATREVEVEDLLLVKVGRGDGTAFERLYDRVSPAVYGLSRRILRNAAQAEEVAQEVMVEIWRTAPRYDPARGRARTWCLTLAHRRAVDRVRSEESARRREDRASLTESTEAPDVGGEVVDVLERQRVTRALDELTDLQRQAVQLAYYEGRTHNQVAELLDVPLGTVKTRIRDGLIRLRDEMGVTT